MAPKSVFGRILFGLIAVYAASVARFLFVPWRGWQVVHWGQMVALLPFHLRISLK